jgi:hypothetical protein
MTPPTGYTEDALVERPAISLLADLETRFKNPEDPFRLVFI